MAHFAEIDQNNKVIRVIVVNNNELIDPNTSQESEQLGIEFCRTLFGQNTNWIQTSYNAAFRYNFAGIDFTWDAINQAFYPPEPFPSWSLDSNYHWQPPVAYPSDGNSYYWDESEQEWIVFQIQPETTNQSGV
jgi:hypothetical protein